MLFLSSTAGPACENYQGEVCFNRGMIGYNKVYINKTSLGQINQTDYEAAMLLLLPTFDKYTEQCRESFHDFLCATNFASCDLSKTTPTPIRVSWHSSHFCIMHNVIAPAIFYVSFQHQTIFILTTNWSHWSTAIGYNYSSVRMYTVVWLCVCLSVCYSCSRITSRHLVAIVVSHRVLFHYRYVYPQAVLSSSSGWDTQFLPIHPLP